MTSFWKRRKQADFTAEIESHIRIEAEQLCEEGVSAPDARAGDSPVSVRERKPRNLRGHSLI